MNFLKLAVAACILILLSMPSQANQRSSTYAPFSQTRVVYSSTNVTTSAWVQLVASTSVEATGIQVFDSSGQTLTLGLGSAGNEVAYTTITPGGQGFVAVDIPAQSRVSVKAISGTASSGELDLDLMR